MVWRQRAVVWAFLALLVQCVSGCAHHHGVSRTWEEIVPVEGTGIGDGSPPTETLLEGRVDFGADQARLLAAVRARGAGTQEVRVQSWRELKSTPWRWEEALFMRPLMAPIYFVMLGPLWSGHIPDYGGDGYKGLIDRSRFAIGVLNPFEAFPLGTNSDKVGEMTGEVRERHEAIVDLGGISADFELELASTRGSARIEAHTEGGELELPLDEDLIALFALGLRGTLHHAESGQSIKVAELNAANMGEYLWRRGMIPSVAGGEDDVLRENAIQVFKSAAAVGSRRGGIDLYKRVYGLEGLEPKRAKSSASASLERMSLKRAHDEGRIDLRVQGRDLRRLNVTLTHRGSERLQVVIPAGTMFDCQGTAQDMVTTVPTEMTFHGAQSLSETLTVACANMNKATPTREDAFVLDEQGDPRLAEISPYLHALSYNSRQAAVWILTDDASQAQLRRFSVPSIGRKEILQAVALFEYAGVDIQDRAIQSWLNSD